MNPADFIRKHITAALTAEGFAPSVVQGVAEALEHYRCMSQSTKKGVVLQIAFFRLGNGLLGRQPPQSGKRQRKSREKVVALLPACSDFATNMHSNLPGGVNS
jgi:hypothetical protein